MKSLDLSHLGGMPFTQETLDYMQASYKEIAQAFGRLGYDGSANPVIISGCKFTVPGFPDTNTGWMYYNGEVIFYAGGDVDANPYVKLTTLTTTAVYDDGSTQVLNKETKLVPCLGTDPDKICLFGDCKYIQHGLGAYAEGYSQEIILNAPSLGLGVSGQVHLRRNELSQTVHVWGSLSISSANLLTDPPIYRQLFSATDIPATHRPVTTVPIPMYIRYHSLNYIQETNGTEHLTIINGELSSGGDFSVGFIKPAAGVTAYTITFNQLLPLL
jgi:hypothetical protein